MKKANVAEFKARLSAYLRSVRKGEKVVVYDRDTPIADVIPHEGETAQKIMVTEAEGDLREIWNRAGGKKRRRAIQSGKTNSLALLLEDRKR